MCTKHSIDQRASVRTNHFLRIRHLMYNLCDGLENDEDLRFAMSAATLGFRRWSTQPCAPAQSAAQHYGIGAGWMDARGKRRLRQGVAGSPVPRRAARHGSMCSAHTVQRRKCSPDSLPKRGWFRRFRFSIPKTLGFLRQFQVSGGGQMPTGYEPVQTFSRRRSFLRALNMLLVNCAQSRFISSPSAIPEFTPGRRSPGVL